MLDKVSRIVPLSDPRIAALATHDNGEPMLALAGHHPRLVTDSSPANLACLGYTPDFSVRQSVLARLCLAADSLPSGLVLVVKEAHRPGRRQAQSFDQRVRQILQQQPDLTIAAAEEIASRFIAPPRVAGPPTGGAVDVTLATDTGQELDLGCPYDTDEAASEGRCYSECAGLSPAVTRHRSILFVALQRQGFVNYPFEWWHWSYGDRYWAFMSGRAASIYAPV